MHLSIVKINTPEMKMLLQTYEVDYENFALNERRPSQAARRACSLALVRDLLVQNHLLPLEQAIHITLQHHESGEPYLKFPEKFPEENPQNLRISISHSGPWSACLITEQGQAAGLDLEDLSIERDYLKISHHFFSKGEIEYVKKCPKEAFYRLWTAKEAIAKLQGKGLAEVLKIELIPPLSSNHKGTFGEIDYRLTQHMTQEYIYTIALQEHPLLESTRRG